MLQVMRRYIRTFFGCKECGQHFEQAAASSLDKVKNPEEQILWLWNQHNMVNYRLAGTVPDDVTVTFFQLLRGKWECFAIICIPSLK